MECNAVKGSRQHSRATLEDAMAPWAGALLRHCGCCVGLALCISHSKNGRSVEVVACRVGFLSFVRKGPARMQLGVFLEKPPRVAHAPLLVVHTTAPPRRTKPRLCCVLHVGDKKRRVYAGFGFGQA